MRSIIFEGNTWSKYAELRKRDKILHRNLCRILKQIQLDDPAKGTGKPEALRHNLSRLWSRRLSKGDRLIYSYNNQSILVLAIGGHYDTI